MIDTGKDFALIDVREQNEFEIVQHPRLGADPEGPHPLR